MAYQIQIKIDQKPEKSVQNMKTVRELDFKYDKVSAVQNNIANESYSQK